MIFLKNIYKNYAGHDVLNNINLHIPKGDIVGIIGGSGAGKSTLLRCINLLERPNQGEVWVNGQNLCQLNSNELRKARQQIGMIFQHYQLLEQQTVLDNICLPMRIQKQPTESIHKRAIELLKLVGLEDKKNAYPHQLSGGQKQRVAIARALSTNPSLILCDEATAALDPTNTNAILNLLVDIQKQFGITLVFITHDMAVAKKICHRLILMKQGKIIETCQWPQVLQQQTSFIRESLYGNIQQHLPEYMYKQLQQNIGEHTILRVLFPGQEATVPFISYMSRALGIDINILAAQIDHSHQQQCGMMLVSMKAEPNQIAHFLTTCEKQHIIGEIIGYVEHIRQ